ncbi:ferrochelatase [Azospirillum sp. sgz301742]
MPTPERSAPKRTAVVLFNLGGPDAPDAIRPFLFNLFYDPAIIGLPTPFRFLLANFIARRREKPAREIYGLIGGKSPLLENTQAQAAALQEALAGDGEVRSFVAMRYWHPMSTETAAAVKEFAPDLVILLPLYPQWSTTTTASSLRVWREAAETVGLKAETRVVCCYPTEPGFIAGIADNVRAAYDEAAKHGTPRVLFSAHGLPKRVIAGGDPYQWQCERTAAAVADALDIPNLDWLNCYQSRVGPLEWIGPSTDAEIRRAGQDKVPILVVPIAFVSEHSETLVEIEIEYRHMAEREGVPHFARVPTVGTSPAFIGGLVRLVRQTMGCDRFMCSQTEGRLCPSGFPGCPQRAS